MIDMRLSIGVDEADHSVEVDREADRGRFLISLLIRRR